RLNTKIMAPIRGGFGKCFKQAIELRMKRFMKILVGIRYTGNKQFIVDKGLFKTNQRFVEILARNETLKWLINRYLFPTISKLSEVNFSVRFQFIQFVR